MFVVWSELQSECPVDISRLSNYANEINTNIPSYIGNGSDLNKIKSRLLDARSNIDSMINSLIRMLHNTKILKKNTDKYLYYIMIDNLGNHLRRLDDAEDHLMVSFDEPELRRSRVGISRLGAYAKLLKLTMNSLIYETLLKAVEEYKEIDENGEIKKEPRTFLYILFSLLQVTLSVMGGITREKSTLKSRKGLMNTIPTNWQGLMLGRGQKAIGDAFKEETGSNIEDLDEELAELNEAKYDMDGGIEDEDS